MSSCAQSLCWGSSRLGKKDACPPLRTCYAAEGTHVRNSGSETSVKAVQTAELWMERFQEEGHSLPAEGNRFSVQIPLRPELEVPAEPLQSSLPRTLGRAQSGGVTGQVAQQLGSHASVLGKVQLRHGLISSLLWRLEVQVQRVSGLGSPEAPDLGLQMSISEPRLHTTFPLCLSVPSPPLLVRKGPPV